jgi:four helix bundle protein|uniref:Four helix bundle protein n=1 Tax=candidate division CPR3 bacterium TaxID=2268181 RepID=A0A7C5YYY2_UNCC3
MTKKKNEQKMATNDKEERLKSYKIALELATKFGQLASVEGVLPLCVSDIALNTVVGILTSISLGEKAKSALNKLRYFSRSLEKVAKCKELITVMRECGWVDEEEYNQMENDTVTLSKMMWGLVKRMRQVATNQQ